MNAESVLRWAAGTFACTSFSTSSRRCARPNSAVTVTGTSKPRSCAGGGLIGAHLVPGGGIEPPLCCQNWILSPARLPIPPSRLDSSDRLHRIRGTNEGDAFRVAPRCRRAVKPALSRKGRAASNRRRLPNRAPSNVLTMTTRKLYRLSDFDFDLPSELIAQTPSTERSGSRLLHVAGARHRDLVFKALPDLVAAGDLLVFNDTRVVRSRLAGRKPSGGRVELLLERIVGPREAWMQIRASHPPRAGGRVELPGGASATV